MTMQVNRDSPAQVRDRILLYAGANEATVRSGLAELADGVVLHGRRGVAAARELRDNGYRGVVAWDADWYSASSPPVGGMFGAAEESVQNQLSVGADVLLSPSTMPLRDDPDAIKKLLATASLFVEQAGSEAPDRPAFVVLPVTPVWTGRLAERLLTDVGEAGLPIAVVLAAWGDPLDDADALDVVLELISTNEAINLRCDLSAIGMVARGALFGAIGQTSTNRHLYLPSRSKPPPSVKDGHVFVPELANWLKRSALSRIPPDSPILVCRCGICEGSSVSRFRPVSSRAEADRHATAAVRDLANEILSQPSRGDRVVRWRSYCRNALSAWEDGLGVANTSKPPGFLIGWTAWSI